MAPSCKMAKINDFIVPTSKVVLVAANDRSSSNLQASNSPEVPISQGKARDFIFNKSQISIALILSKAKPHDITTKGSLPILRIKRLSDKEQNFASSYESTSS